MAHSTQSSSKQPGHHDDLDATLRRMEFDGPDPSLRRRTLTAVGQVLDSAESSRAQHSWLGRTVWIAAAVLLLVWALPKHLISPPASVVAASDDSAATAAFWLDLEEDLARHVGTRLAGTGRQRSKSVQLKTKGSSSHDRYSFDHTNL